MDLAANVGHLGCPAGHLFFKIPEGPKDAQCTPFYSWLLFQDILGVPGHMFLLNKKIFIWLSVVPISNVSVIELYIFNYH